MNGTPAGGSGPPEAIAYAAVYLASDEAAFVYGTVIDVDGGRGPNRGAAAGRWTDRLVEVKARNGNQ